MEIMKETVRTFERLVYFEVRVERNRYGGAGGRAEAVLRTLNGTCNETLEDEIPQNTH